jgi:hypothetical protein
VRYDVPVILPFYAYALRINCFSRVWNECCVYRTTRSKHADVQKWKGSTLMWPLNLTDIMNLCPWKLRVEQLLMDSPSLWNPKVHYHVHKNPPLVSFLNQKNPVHNVVTSFFNTQFNILPSKPSCTITWTLPFSYSDKNAVCISQRPCVLRVASMSSSLMWLS